jgi:hypothetical protein
MRPVPRDCDTFIALCLCRVLITIWESRGLMQGPRSPLKPLKSTEGHAEANCSPMSPTAASMSPTTAPTVGTYISQVRMEGRGPKEAVSGGSKEEAPCGVSVPGLGSNRGYQPPVSGPPTGFGYQALGFGVRVLGVSPRVLGISAPGLGSNPVCV